MLTTSVSRRRSAARLIALAIGLNLAWRTLRYLLVFPIWGDEAFVAINFLVRDFRGMIRPLEYGQIAPLGFMWAELAVIRLLGVSEWSLRLLPFAAGIGTMLLFWKLARSLLDRYAALLAIAIFAASYYTVRHATEVKPYSIDLFISLVLTLLALHVSQRPSSLSRWFLLTIVGAFSMWISYTAVFVAGAVGMFLMLHARRHLAALTVYGLTVAGSFAAMYFLYARPQSQIAPWLWDIPMWQNAWPPIREPWRLPIWFLQIHAGNMFAYPVGAQNGGSTLTFVLFVVGFVVFWRKRRDVLLLLLGPLVLLFIAAALQKYPYGTSARVSLFMAPAICLLAGAGLSAVLRALLPRPMLANGLGIATVILLTIAIGGMARDVVHPYKQFSDQENRRAIRWLAEQTRAGDEWLVFNGLVDTPYAPGLGLWGGGGARFRFYVSTLAPARVQWAPDPDVYVHPGGHSWLIAYRHYEVPFPEEMFSAYLQKLTGRLGSPQCHHFSLGGLEAIDIYEFATDAIHAQT